MLPASTHLPIDLLILSNGPGELMTWVRPTVQALRQRLGDDPAQVRISVVLSPCPNASGREAELAQSFAGVDRVQAAADFWPFLLWGKTAASWDWRDRGIVLFLGGDQFFAVVLGQRLHYGTVVYAEWEARWHRWIDRYGVMQAKVRDQMPIAVRAKATIVGDLMADVRQAACLPHQISPPNQTSPPDRASPSNLPNAIESIGILPGSKAAKLTQGVPLGLAIAQAIHARRPQTKFLIPVAPTLSLEKLASYADLSQNPIAAAFLSESAQLREAQGLSYLTTASGLEVELVTRSPAYDRLVQCRFCLTTVGANTAELGALGVPMIVLLPTQQLDAMRSWDGLPGLLANLPGLGTAFAKLINGWFLRQSRLLAWPNLWAGRSIVPELVGQLQPEAVAALAIDWLEQPTKLVQIQQDLQQVRGEAGAAAKLAQLVVEQVAEQAAEQAAEKSAKLQ